ncbi:C4-dicarboxylate ABC transporter [Malaciobacter molluscorum LMG 25693]|uniref:C4-dicarboxylate ABC transporter n=1 Tax=Malaciobacter molluscorum LMG 25693 TaxID=870501 RepID=A0A2G1DGM6_9BACT|nr:SLAC1 anion channel family protein [Malaciobacter molluscorum]AXX92504.1 tellurite-resistance/dicarboxylate transporter (TDT) family protein [Malaciobacter molluscorum LMG 25693]PHO17627.1 C4-dicarboxylate ABC transporter [Malaciobacter molluscorum LMG 25693]RXJ93475.1 C4-dicarboxylate ABC transporter [Malaciobacter molluscorum]
MSNESIKAIPSNRLAFFPVMMFAIVMGLSGLTIVYEKASEVFFFHIYFYLFFKIVTTIIFIAIFVLYIIKIVIYFQEVKKEFSHPIRINFFAAISISFLLISQIYHENITVSNILFFIGMFLHIFFTFNTLKFWINNNLEIQHSNPAWFIPIVGNLIVPVVGTTHLDNMFLMFFFSIGIFFWIIMLAIILNRIIFHTQFAPKFMPTLFILIAPPSVGLIAYFKMTSNLDFFSMILFNLGLFFTFLLFFMYKNFVKIKFFISWWAFTFPLATIALASSLMYEVTKKDIYQYFSYLFIIVLTAVVFVVAYKTIIHMLNKQICIME